MGWPRLAGGDAVKVHGMDADSIFTGDGDIAAARDLVASTGLPELFLHPGGEHLFADPTLPFYDPRRPGCCSTAHSPSCGRSP